MYTNKSIQLHSKCLSILGLIQELNNRIDEQRSKLYRYDHAKNWMEPIRLMNTRDEIIAKSDYHKSIKERLVRYYANTMGLLVEDTMAKCYPVKPVTGNVLLVTSVTY